MIARLTVRARITALATVVVLIVLVIASVGLVVLQRRLLTETLDESLSLRADELAAMGDEVPLEITGQGEDDAVAQVVHNGAVVASTANVAGEGPVVDVPVDDGQEIVTVDEMVHEDSAFRVLTRTEGDETIIVGGTLDDIEESITTLIQSLVVAVPLVVAALAVALWWLVGRTLRPVEAIRAEVTAIGARELHRRVPVPPGDDEIARLATTMNDMLERVDRAARRQQRFVADASHELRSPLTRIRTELEVDLAHPERADLMATHRSVLDETLGLQRLADDLLLVARADEGKTGDLRRELVDLDDIVLRVARRLRADDRVRVDLTGVGAGRVVGDRDLLARLVGNLADNAVRHASSVVDLALVERDGQVVLAVQDDGRGVPESEREHIFQRFARLDSARSTAGGGTGLGLAIARDIAEQHGGTLVLDPGPTGARFVLTLPSAP